MNENEEQSRKMTAVLALGELFGRQLTEPAVRMYLASLRDIGAEAIERAAASAASSSKFFPTPVELRELSGDIRPEDRAALAWESVLRAVPGVGGYRSPDFDDPVINATVRSMGGWVALCDQTIEQQDRFTRAQFLKTYTGLTRTGISDELGAPLVGIAEKHNQTHRLDGYDASARVATGLPWAGKPVKRLGDGRQGVPLLELKKP